jgi:hypothetical protein
MSSVRVPPRTLSPPQAKQKPGARESRLSRYCLLWLPAAPFAGFALAGRVLILGADGDWELWKTVILGVTLMAPFVAGACFGLRSVLKGFRGGWVGLVVNLVLATLAFGMPLGEALND